MRCGLGARTACAAVAVLCAFSAFPADSQANGRFPATTNVRLQPGEANVIYLPATFGLLVSTDAGESFHWVCEAAIGYGGMYDPDYAVTPSGDVYATTFEGLRVSRDGGCTWETLSDGIPPTAFQSEVEIGPDGRVWVPTSTGQGPNDVYVSADGTTFVSANLPEEKAWWLSVRTTPIDPQRIYVSGLLPQQGSGTTAQAFLRRSLDGGQTWEVLPVDGFAFGDQPRVYVLGVSPNNADVLFARVVGGVEPAGDAVYRSSDGGLTWELKIEFQDFVSAFHIRPGATSVESETILAASVNACPGDPDLAAKGCVKISQDGGATWRATAEQPRLACIEERGDGVLFGCGANWDPDNFALGRSTDGETWEKVYRFSETAGPLECEAATEQAECAATAWQGVCEMLGLCRPPDAGLGAEDDGGEDGEGSGDGCCRVGGNSDVSWLAGVLLVLVALLWRRRRRAPDGGTGSASVQPGPARDRRDR